MRAMAIEKDEKGLPKFKRPSADLKKDIEKSQAWGMRIPPAANPERDAAAARLSSETVDRLRQLCDFYKISPSPQQYLELAFRLARDFVPNFDLSGRKKGRARALRILRLAMRFSFMRSRRLRMSAETASLMLVKF
jgi:hypothetical protein